MNTLRWRDRLFRVLLWGVAISFAMFLTGLGSLVIGDLPRIERQANLEDFLDLRASIRIDDGLRDTQRLMRELKEERETAGLALEAARNATRTMQESFRNWISTRGTVGSSTQDDEVLTRTRALDQLRATERDRQLAVEALDAKWLAARQQYDGLTRDRNAMDHEAQRQLSSAERSAELRVFGFRLALTLPLLVIAGWLMLRHRNGRWWPFVWGFTLFAGFAFFVELVPYLPSYGGYVRQAVGVLLTVVIGIALVRAAQRYQRQSEEQATRPQTERRSGIEYAAAIQHMQRGICPSCDSSFRLLPAPVRRAAVETELDPDFCMHCGLRLFERCPHCTTRHNAFFRYCQGCGSPTSRAAIASRNDLQPAPALPS